MSEKTPSKKTLIDKEKIIKQFEFQLNLNQFFNKSLIYILIGLLFLPFIISLVTGGKREQISVSQLVKDIREKKVEKLEVAGAELRIQYKDDQGKKIARKEDGQEAATILKNAGIDLAEVDFAVQDVSTGRMIWEVVMNFLPIIAMALLFFFIFRQARGGQDGIMGIGRSKAKIFVKGKQNTKFSDVGGMTESKQELEEIVDFLKNPKKYTKVGARTPKGVLLVGPSGTGKTLLARAVAGEAGVQFLSIAGSEFMEMLVGVGASRARDLFSTAKKLAPSIIFIDEIDAIGRIRGQGSMGGHDEREQTLNQILVEMDGFNPNEQVVVIAATNRGDLLDTALLRPGRFDRRVIVDFPDAEGRKAIATIHAKGKPFDESVNWDRVARRTVGYSGADLENMLNEAAISAARVAREKINMEDIEDAATKVKLGPEKKRLQSDLDRKLTAYHEVGHAVVSHFLPNTDPVHRISIVSRGMALGYTLIPPAKDKLHETKTHLLEKITVMMGGRAAEEVFMNQMTTGASNDFDQATQVAKAMVIEYGMSSLGPINFGPNMDVTE
ncbi:MAG TPA: cell division protein FtsH, partial [Candidatus Pacebacteria bacterium]|nr:cell division protein FtsH [Candidatus Paceibacterota bacterium]